MTSRSFPLLSIGLAALLLVAACGGVAADDGGLATLESGESGETTTTTEGATEADAEEAALEFSQCMRDNGVPDFPDPTFTENGGGIAVGGGPDGEGPGFDPQSEEVQAAFEACGDLLEGAAFGPGGGNFDATELQDNLLAMAECLRGQGLEVDDPDLSNFGPAAGGPPPDTDEIESEGGQGPGGQGFSIFGDLDIDDPDVQAAMETCQGEFGFTGPGSDAATEDGEG
jgi:hypothetical protein